MYTLLVLFVAYTAVYSLIWHLQGAEENGQPRRRTAEIAAKAPPTTGAQAKTPSALPARQAADHKV